jgi:charged multivesicular body protein 7
MNIDQNLLRGLENKQFGRPLALGTVVREGVSEKDLLPLRDFLNAKDSIYHTLWSSMPWNVVSWTIRQLGFGESSSGDDKLPSGQFIVTKNLEAATKLLIGRIQKLPSHYERTFTKSHFRKTFADGLIQSHTLSETDLEVLLRFISRDKNLAVYDGNTIRLKGSTQEGPLTEEDATIASLKELIEDIKHQAGLLSKRIDELTAVAKDAVVRKSRVSALAALKSKKLAESALGKRYDTLSQLEELANKIQQAADQVQIVKVMESSAGVLRNLNQKVGGTERVEEVVDRLREQMSEVDEVGNIIAEAGSDTVIIDESEIDDELAELEIEEKRKAEVVEKAKREALEAKEAAELQRRLEDIGQVPPPLTSENMEEQKRREKDMMTPTTEAAEKLRRMSLEERPQAQAQLAE